MGEQRPTEGCYEGSTLWVISMIFRLGICEKRAKKEEKKRYSECVEEVCKGRCLMNCCDRLVSSTQYMYESSDKEGVWRLISMLEDRYDQVDRMCGTEERYTHVEVEGV